MNQKDLAELKKHFLPMDDLLVVEKVFSAFVDGEKTSRFRCVRGFAEIPEEEMASLYELLGKVLRGRLGKGLREYEFPNEMYEEDKPQNLLWELLEKGLDDEEQMEKYASHLYEKLVYTLPYAVFIAQCRYTVFEKNKLGEKNKYDSREYRFLLGAVCPVEPRAGGLIYDEEENNIIRKTRYDRVVAETPTDGFLFPTFTGRGADVNHVMYFAKKSREPNISLVEEVLGCHYTLSAEEEKETFRAILNKTVGEQLNLNVLASVNEKIQDFSKIFKDDPEPPVVTDTFVRDVLLDAGVKPEQAAAAQSLYLETTEGNFFTASNLTDPKTTLSAGGVMVSISGDAAGKITTREEGGRRFLVISLDDPEVTVNGIQMKM